MPFLKSSIADCSRVVLEELEARIAPANFFAQADGTILNAQGSVYQEFDASLADAVSADAAYLFQPGDKLILDNSNLKLDRGETVYLDVQGGAGVFFFTDLNDGGTPWDITGIAAANKFGGTINGSIHGDIATVLSSQQVGKTISYQVAVSPIDTMAIQAGTISSLTVNGWIAGGIFAGTSLSNIKVTAFDDDSYLSVGRGLFAGSGGDGAGAVSFGEGSFVLDPYGAPDGAAGGSISNISLKGGCPIIIAGDGAFSSTGVGGAGGSVSTIAMGNLSNQIDLYIQSGHGASGVKGGGGGGSITTIKLSGNGLASLNIFAGIGGDADTDLGLDSLRGGVGGSIKGVTVDLGSGTAGSLQIVGGTGGAGDIFAGEKNGVPIYKHGASGSGGSVSGVLVTAFLTADLSIWGGWAGGLNFTTGYDPHAAFSEHGFTATGGQGGSVNGVQAKIFGSGSTIGIFGGYGSDGYLAAGAGGSLTAINIYGDDISLVNLIGGEGGQGLLNNPSADTPSPYSFYAVGKGGAGGSIGSVGIQPLSKNAPGILNMLEIYAGSGGSAADSILVPHEYILGKYRISMGAAGGAGGSILGLTVGNLLQAVDMDANSVVVISGHGGNASYNSLAGAAGDISQIKQLALDTGASVFLQTGLGGQAYDLGGKGGAGGDISSIVLKGDDIATVVLLAGMFGPEATDPLFSGGDGYAGAGVAGAITNISLQSFSATGKDGDFARLEHFVSMTGDGGISFLGKGANGGSISGIKTINTLVDSASISSGWGGESWANIGGSGGNISGVGDAKGFLMSEGSLITITAGTGGDGYKGGGSGGTVSSATIKGDSIDSVEIFGGHGGAGANNEGSDTNPSWTGGAGKGGNGGTISGITISGLSGSGEAGLVHLVGGTGGFAVTYESYNIKTGIFSYLGASGGAGGGIASVKFSIFVQDLQIVGGEGGIGSYKAAGGAGGNVSGISASLASHGSVLIYGGHGGMGDGKGGNGGSLSSCTFSGDEIGHVQLWAGSGNGSALNASAWYPRSEYQPFVAAIGGNGGGITNIAFTALTKGVAGTLDSLMVIAGSGGNGSDFQEGGIWYGAAGGNAGAVSNIRVSSLASVLCINYDEQTYGNGGVGSATVKASGGIGSTVSKITANLAEGGSAIICGGNGASGFLKGGNGGGISGLSLKGDRVDSIVLAGGVGGDSFITAGNGGTVGSNILIAALKATKYNPGLLASFYAFGGNGGNADFSDTAALGGAGGHVTGLTIRDLGVAQFQLSGGNGGSSSGSSLGGLGGSLSNATAVLLPGVDPAGGGGEGGVSGPNAKPDITRDGVIAATVRIYNYLSDFWAVSGPQ